MKRAIWELDTLVELFFFFDKPRVFIYIYLAPFCSACFSYSKECFCNNTFIFSNTSILAKYNALWSYMLCCINSFIMFSFKIVWWRMNQTQIAARVLVLKSIIIALK